MYLVGEVADEVVRRPAVGVETQTTIARVVADQVRHSARYQHVRADVKLTAVQ